MRVCAINSESNTDQTNCIHSKLGRRAELICDIYVTTTISITHQQRNSLASLQSIDGAFMHRLHMTCVGHSNKQIDGIAVNLARQLIIRSVLQIITHRWQGFFLKVFPSIAIYPLLRVISWNLTTRCLAVSAAVMLVNAAD